MSDLAFDLSLASLAMALAGFGGLLLHFIAVAIGRYGPVAVFSTLCIVGLLGFVVFASFYGAKVEGELGET